MPDKVIPAGELADEDDELDATGIDYTADPVPDDELDLVILSPEGDDEKVRGYAALFGKDA